MYYEERVINGVLCWRSTPNGEWRQMSAVELTRKLQRARHDVRVDPDQMRYDHDRWCAPS